MSHHEVNSEITVSSLLPLHGELIANSRRANSKVTVWDHLVSLLWGRWVASKWACHELSCEPTVCWLWTQILHRGYQTYIFMIFDVVNLALFQNSLQDSLNTFRDVSHNSYLSRTDFVLILNKKDVFEERIKQVSLTHCFPDYKGLLMENVSFSVVLFSA